MLPPEVSQSLSTLLQVLSSSDNVTRAEAEEALNNDWTTNRPDVLLMGLVEQIQSTQDAAVGTTNPYFRPRSLPHAQTRSFAAVLFRRIASKSRKDPATTESKELFLYLGNDQKNFIRQRLLQCLANEQTPNVRHKIGDAVAEVARQYTDNSGSKRGQHPQGYLTDPIDESWPELLGALFQASNSTDAGQRESAFRIFATTPGIIEKQHEGAVQEVFAKGFKDEDVNVRR